MASSSDPSRWLELYGDTLYRYALLRVHRPEVAEDLVQETLLAALQSRHNFAGKASEKTWLVGILKHKIIDYFRKASREILSNSDDESLIKGSDPYFDEQGRWQIAIQAWSEPDKSLERQQFQKALADCINKLPPRLATLFFLREFDGLSSEEICKALKVSTTNNLWVMLSRMRLRLRNCLDTHWFNKNRE